MTIMLSLTVLRAALKSVFEDLDFLDADYLPEVYSAEDDPGGWARSSEAVIHVEGFVPFDTAVEVEVALTESLDGFYIQPINSAVWAVYSCE